MSAYLCLFICGRLLNSGKTSLKEILVKNSELGEAHKYGFGWAGEYHSFWFFCFRERM